MISGKLLIRHIESYNDLVRCQECVIIQPLIPFIVNA